VLKLNVGACELLAPIYGWFTEGFDPADIRGESAPLRTGMSSRAPASEGWTRGVQRSKQNQSRNISLDKLRKVELLSPIEGPLAASDD
jgi:hypothetical protein